MSATTHAVAMTAVHVHGSPEVRARVVDQGNCIVLELIITDPATGGDLARHSIYLHGSIVGITDQARDTRAAIQNVRDVGTQIITQIIGVERDRAERPVPPKQSL